MKIIDKFVSKDEGFEERKVKQILEEITNKPRITKMEIVRKASTQAAKRIHEQLVPDPEDDFQPTKKKEQRQDKSRHSPLEGVIKPGVSVKAPQTPEQPKEPSPRKAINKENIQKYRT